MDYETATRLLKKYRKNTRPKFYSADSGQETQISAEFETELILMDNGVKKSLVQRLREISDTSSTDGVANNLLKDAVKYDLGVEGDRASELQFLLGDLQEFQAKMTSASSLAEMQSVMGVITTQAGPSLFEYDQAVNRAIHSTILKQKVENRKAANTKRELSSWIGVISTYITA